MKQKMLKIIIVIVTALILILIAWYILFMYFDIGPAFPLIHTIAVEVYPSSGVVSESEPLMALAESEEMAKEIAGQYGIVFVSFQNGVATYDTDEDPEQVIARGEDNGYPTLYLNYQKSLYDSSMPQEEEQ
ncbi:MAG: hypothetical protein LUI12_06160 [Clostridiales bacterium]|nr:hypothetical protein [Clostridiales bacterium]